jgi:hypothetical protein
MLGYMMLTLPRCLVTCALVSFLIPLVAHADAVLYVSPEKGTYTIGQTFDVKIYADSGGALINAAEGDLTFDTQAFEVVSISTEDSILQSWVSPPEFSNAEGTIHFAGWTKKNYSGVSGLMATVTFKALKNSVGNLRLVAGAILAANGKESNIITDMRSGIFTIKSDEPELPLDDASSTNENGAIAAKVPPPVFDDYPSAIAVGDHIVLRGTAEPNAHVYVWLARGSESEKQTEILTASDGTFTYVSDDAVSAGIYHIRAAVETADGRQSMHSDMIDIAAVSSGMAATAAFGVSMLFETIPFFAIMVLGGLGGAYIYHRHQVAKMHYGRHSMFDTQE